MLEHLRRLGYLLNRKRIQRLYQLIELEALLQKSVSFLVSALT